MDFILVDSLGNINIEKYSVDNIVGFYFIKGQKELPTIFQLSFKDVDRVEWGNKLVRPDSRLMVIAQGLIHKYLLDNRKAIMNGSLPKAIKIRKIKVGGEELFVFFTIADSINKCIAKKPLLCKLLGVKPYNYINDKMLIPRSEIKQITKEG